jgi:hypothetical protein
MKNRTLIALAALAVAGGGFAAEPIKRKQAAGTTNPLTYAKAVSFFKEAKLRDPSAETLHRIFRGRI